jgi:hypothetical protein
MITLPFAGKTSDAALITDAAITPASKIVVFWGAVSDLDENGPEEAVTFTATPTSGSALVRVSSNQPFPVGGQYKIRYLLAS